MKVRVHVSLKPGVLDPQGRAIHHSLESLGFAGVRDVRAGRLIELDADEGVDDAALDAMCRQLLANLVIESYRIERPGPAPAPAPTPAPAPAPTSGEGAAA